MIARPRAWNRFVLLYEINRFWEQCGVWWVIRLIPRGVKKWVIVQAAVKAGSGNNPKYNQMHDVFVKQPPERTRPIELDVSTEDAYRILTELTDQLAELDEEERHRGP